jgi:hypothetical protein
MIARPVNMDHVLASLQAAIDARQDAERLEGAAERAVFEADEALAKAARHADASRAAEANLRRFHLEALSALRQASILARD